MEPYFNICRTQSLGHSESRQGWDAGLPASVIEYVIDTSAPVINKN